MECAAGRQVDPLAVSLAPEAGARRVVPVSAAAMVRQVVRLPVVRLGLGAVALARRAGPESPARLGAVKVPRVLLEVEVLDARVATLIRLRRMASSIFSSRHS